MKKTIVAAYGLNRELGKNNDLIWHLPEDLKHFKSITSGHPIIMGRKTYESIGRPLPNRQNIVISRQNDLAIPGCTVVSSLEGAYTLLQEQSQVFLIGGGQIYKQYLNEVDVLEITEVQQEFDADTFFPKIDLELWKEVSRIKNKADSKNKFDFDFVRYEKI